MAKKAAITVHAGHNKNGKIACGASDYIDESKEARIIARKVIRILRRKGYTVYNCTVNNGTSQNDVLKKIVSKINSKKRVLDVSVHFNAYTHSTADDKTKGVECLIRNKSGKKSVIATDICKNISTATGLRNRGVKENTGLYFLNRSEAEALLIEVCFVDDQDDVRIYKKSKTVIAYAIANAIMKHV